MTNYDKFILVTGQLYRRYARLNQKGQQEIVTHVGGKRTLYQYYCDLASIKYLGCRPEKLRASYEIDGVVR